MDQQKFAKNNVTRALDNKNNILIESDQAAVVKDAYPKAQYHFLVVAKENIVNVTALKREHLPLLDHMMELANQIIEQQEHLPPSNFLVGFKIDAFMNRLIMHVISNDFYSVSMRRITHWNSFNTNLFLTYQAVYAFLRVQGSISLMSDDQALQLRTSKQLHCNQCDFESRSFVALKGHLFEHWKKREDDFELKKQVNNITKMLDESKLDATQGKEESPIEKPQADEQAKSMPGPVPVPTNWRQNPDQKPSNIKNYQKEPAANWRETMNQPPTGQQSMVPYQNQFTKHFQMSVDRQNQPHRIVNPMHGQGIMGPSPFGQSKPNWQPRPQFDQFSKQFQMSNVRQNQPHRFVHPIQGQGIVGPSPSGQNKPNWKPKLQYNQAQNKSINDRVNSTQNKTQSNEGMENTKWKPKNKPQHNQGQTGANKNEAEQEKPKWKPKQKPKNNQNITESQAITTKS